jgi:hypothetical protein
VFDFGNWTGGALKVDGEFAGTEKVGKGEIDIIGIGVWGEIEVEGVGGVGVDGIDGADGMGVEGGDDGAGISVFFPFPFALAVYLH